jgi:AAHS family 4-hydroxybenzoate transporter-like MFS transporter
MDRHPARDDGSINVQIFIDAAPFGKYQRGLLFLCFLTAFIDGFDVNSIPVAAPQLRRDMALEPAELGMLFAAGAVSIIVSSLTISWFADRWGRRPLMTGSLIASAVVSFGFVFATRFDQLLLLRLVGCYCLAGAITGAYAYAAELAPKRATAKAVIITSTGFGCGVSAAGFLSGSLIEAWGWHGIFYFGGCATFLVAALLWIVLPESPHVEALRPNSGKRVAAILRKIDPRAKFGDDPRFHLDEEVRSGLSFGSLLRGGRLWPVLGLWISAFFIAFVIGIVASWLPLIVTDAGGNPHQAGSSIGVFKVGAIVSSLLLAAYIDKRANPYSVLIPVLVLSSVPIVGLSGTSATTLLFVGVVALAGISLGGPQYAWNALITRIFPTSLRAAGVSTYRGFGAAGAAAGPLAAGFLLQAGWTTSQVLLALVWPISAATAIVVGLWVRERRHGTPAERMA